MVLLCNVRVCGVRKTRRFAGNFDLSVSKTTEENLTTEFSCDAGYKLEEFDTSVNNIGPAENALRRLLHAPL